jgi:2-oxoglutarate dehydrogenase E2 component (dihydrolipoamide succinyltransferase)
MKLEIKVPSVGESVTEALLAEWFKNDGEPVKKDEPLFVLETDKVTLEVAAEADGVLSIQTPAGETVAIGAVVGFIDTEAPPKAEAPAKPEKPAAREPVASAPTVAEQPAAASEQPEAAEIDAAGVAPPTSAVPDGLAPSVRRLVAQKHLDVSRISGTGPGGRITKGDVLLFLEQAPPQAVSPPPAPQSLKAAPAVQPASAQSAAEATTRTAMSPIRRRIAERLLAAKQNTAMLTTFNDIDMSRVQALRGEYREAFKEKYGVSLGFMSFFIKATVEALKEFPQLNAFVEGSDIIEHHYYHIGVAVGSERGLVVPVIRHADRLSFAELETAIVDYVKKINDNRLELKDLEDGTFTITNGGVFGSLLSTPILNAPQSGILGMHRVEQRPMVINDEIVVRPMMYVALSYDHRIVDGREAVTFLRRIKACVENPERMMMEI